MIVGTAFRATGRPSFGWQWNTFFFCLDFDVLGGDTLELSVEYLTLIVCSVSIVLVL